MGIMVAYTVASVGPYPLTSVSAAAHSRASAAGICSPPADTRFIVGSSRGCSSPSAEGVMHKVRRAAVEERVPPVPGVSNDKAGTSAQGHEDLCYDTHRRRAMRTGTSCWKA